MSSSTRVHFEGSQGHALAGDLHPSMGPQRGTALFAHCFTCSKDLHAARLITEALAKQGFAVLRFDFTGLGRSEGDFADTTFTTDVSDLVAAAEFMAGNVGAPTLLVGHSLGGAAVYRAAPQLPSVRAVASLAAPASPSHLTHLFEHVADDLEAHGTAVVSLAGRPFQVKQAFLDDLQAHPLTDDLRDLKRAVLILHSPTDTTVGIENASELFQAAWHPKSFISLDGADHLLTNPEDASYAGSVIASWAARYASVPAVASAHDDDVETTTGAGFRTAIIAHGVHHLVADEPASVGGHDTGPSPFELVSAGLGACTGMTLRMYADRKKWPLTNTRVHLRHRSEKVDGQRVDHLTREVEIEGEALTDEQRARLLEIANRCPVHRALEKGFTIETTGG